MSSRCLNRSTLRLVAAALGATLASAASGHAWGDDSASAASRGAPTSVAVTTLFPAGGSAPPEDPRAKQYQGNAKAIGEGQRLFDSYNCSGCHFHGAGGMGPALMDDQWLYGSRLDQIYTSIYQGRPNGMPSWAGKIPDQQLWEIAAFVKSLSTPSAANGPGQPKPTPPPPAASPVPSQ